MQVPPFVEKYKMPVIAGSMVIVTVIVALIFLIRIFTTQGQAISGASLLPKSFVAVGDLINKDKVSLKDKSFMESYFIKNAKDYTTVVPESTSRGRDNPFAPYDSFRPTR